MPDHREPGVPVRDLFYLVCPFISLVVRSRMAKSCQLAEIERLETELEDLLNDPSVSELKSENEKLSYQIKTLHRAIIQESENSIPPQG